MKSGFLQRILRWLMALANSSSSMTTLGIGIGPGPDFGSPRDPYSRKPAPVRSGPKSRSGAVAVAEPDE
jgi:hypothetical protein